MLDVNCHREVHGIHFWIHCVFRLDALAWSVIATATWLAGWLAVHSGIVSKPLNLSENFFDHLKVKDKCEKQTKMKPSQIYSELTANETDESACPRNLKQVQNVSVQLTSNLIASNNHGTNNLADEMKTLCSQD